MLELNQPYFWAFAKSLTCEPAEATHATVLFIFLFATNVTGAAILHLHTV